MKNSRTRRPARRHRAAELCLGLALISLTSCETITGVAPAHTPRVEIELSVVVEEGFLAQVENVDASLFGAVREAVREKANLGLRFYPTPTEMYEDGDQRPPYLMLVTLDRLHFVFDHRMVQEEDAEPEIEASLVKVGCEATARVEHRRENAPSLVVASASGSSLVSAERDPDAIAAGKGYVPHFEAATLKVLEKDIKRAVGSAVDKALKSMRTPIDREFAPEEEEPAAPRQE